MWYFWRVCLWVGFVAAGFAVALVGYSFVLTAQIRDEVERQEADEKFLREAGAPPEYQEQVRDAHQEALRPDRERRDRFEIVGLGVFLCGMPVGVLGALAPGAKRPKRPKDPLAGTADESW